MARMAITSRKSDPDGDAARIVTLAIETVGAEGDGVSPGPVFTPLTLPGETVVARRTGERAELIEILEASAGRVAAPCPHFGACGGCALQHWDETPYLAWKRERIGLALARERLETEILAPFAAPPGSRRRLALHARREGREAVLGFKARRSWRLTAIETCVIADPAIVAALPVLRRLAAPFLEHPRSAPILHATWTATGLDVDVTGVERRAGGLSADARMRAAAVAAAADMARVSLAGEVLYSARPARVRMGAASVALPPGAFLQAVEAAERAMARFALAESAGARGIADLYCGVGAFSFPLASLAPVLAADASAPAIAALTTATASAPGLKTIAAQVRDLDRRPMSGAELKRIDVVLIDPPRAGAAAQSAALARSAVAKVIAVSCNPATFARDAAILTSGGFTLDRVLPVDQFLWSPHIELVGVFSR